MQCLKRERDLIFLTIVLLDFCLRRSSRLKTEQQTADGHLRAVASKCKQSTTALHMQTLRAILVPRAGESGPGLVYATFSWRPKNIDKPGLHVSAFHL